MSDFRNLSLLVIAYCVSISMYSQNISFANQYGGTLDDIAFEGLKSSDNNFYILGWSKSYSNGETDYYLLKTDPAGNMLWQKHFGGFDSETGISLLELANNRLVLAGTTRSYGYGFGDCYILLTDKNGNLIKEFVYGASGEDYLRKIIISKDGNLVYTGFTDSFGYGKKDILVSKIDTNGNLLWQKTFGGPQEDEGWSIFETQDGGFIVGGFKSLQNGSLNNCVIKIDKEGNQKWEKLFGSEFIDYGVTDVKQSDDGNFLVLYSRKPSPSNREIFQIVKLSQNGDLIWTKSHNNHSGTNGRYLTTFPNGFAVSGWLNKTQGGDRDIFLATFDLNGNYLKEYIFGGIYNDEGWKVNYSNGSFQLAGSIKNESNLSLNAFFANIPIDNNNNNITCKTIVCNKDAAIGKHDFFNTSINNYGNAIQNAAYCISGAVGGLNINRALMHFDLTDIPPNSNIISAKLNLYATGPIGTLNGHLGNNQSVLQRVLFPWEEPTVTWDNQPMSTSQNQVILAQSSSSNQDYLNIDVFTLIKDLNSLENNGIILKLQNEMPENGLLFYSSDYQI